jgi:8-oxo-dGTP diphosphatase
MQISRLYPPVPLLGVSILCHHGDEVLLIKRSKPPYQDHWSLPGGLVEVGEELRAAAKRELAEETGATADLTVPVETFDSIERDGDGRVRSHFVLTVFCGPYLSGAVQAGDDALEAMWFHRDRLDGQLFTPGTPERILRLLPQS